MKQNIYTGQFETLLSFTQDDFTLINFFNGSKNDIERWQIAVEFIYRCLKCKILINLSSDNFKHSNNIINSFEEIAHHISKYTPNDTLYSRIHNPILSQLNEEIWYADIYTCSKTIDKLAKECHLTAYEDYWEDDNDPRWIKFQNAIEKIFAEHHIPWSFEHPLFPVRPAK